MLFEIVVHDIQIVAVQVYLVRLLFQLLQLFVIGGLGDFVPVDLFSELDRLLRSLVKINHVVDLCVVIKRFAAI